MDEDFERRGLTDNTETNHLKHQGSSDPSESRSTLEKFLFSSHLFPISGRGPFAFLICFFSPSSACGPFSNQNQATFAIPPAIYRAPKPGFPKTAAETAVETAGETRGAGGTAAETAGKSAVPVLLRATALFPAVSAAVPPAPRVFLAVSTAVSAAVLGNPGVGAL